MNPKENKTRNSGDCWNLMLGAISIRLVGQKSTYFALVQHLERSKSNYVQGGLKKIEHEIKKKACQVNKER